MSFLGRMFRRYYVVPERVTLEGYTYCEKYSSYSDRNYLQPSIASFLRRWHFEYALRLTQKYFHNADVIDFGCADGPLLPSLSRYFNHVTAIDANPTLIKLASELSNKMCLSNVELICNARLTINDLRQTMPKYQYHVLYLLETLEHIGSKSSPWDTRVNFLKDLFGLVAENGIIVISVPNMIGMSFLLQRLGLFVFRQQREPISMVDLLKASLFNNTAKLENQWNSGHIGFNHKKLEGYLKKEFQIVKKKNLVFNVIYVLAAKPG